MRIIAGQARGRRLATLAGEDTRPTLERVKEGMFSALQFWLPGARVLDLYAGSGQLGLEAVSRGAKNCVFVDDSPKAIEIIRQNVEALGYSGQCRVVRSVAGAYLARCHEHFDLILADPPYRDGIAPGIVAQAAAVAAPGALLVCEHEPDADMPAEAAGFALEKQYRYGTVMLSRYKYKEDEEA